MFPISTNLLRHAGPLALAVGLSATAAMAQDVSASLSVSMVPSNSYGRAATPDYVPIPRETVNYVTHHAPGTIIVS